MESFVLSRLRRMSEGLGIGTDACSKSLRGYDTHILKLFLERLQVHFPILGQGKLVKGMTFTYHNSRIDGYSGSNLMNDLFSSFYLQEPREDEELYVIYPKISNKTKFPDPGDETDPIMRDSVINWIKDYSTEDVTSLRSVASSQLGTPTLDNLLDDFRNSSLSQSIISFLIQHQNKFPAAESVDCRSRVIHQDLIMDVKYYPARDDNRAYCRDTNRLRQVVGACLNRLVLPKSKVQRKRMKVASVFNDDEKDILKLSIPMSTRETFVSKLVLLDISNFTGSFANSWIMIFIMALDSQVNLRNKYNYYGFGQSLLLASWHEILVIYLYLTVGYPCYVDSLDEYHTLPGGFLGVNANITTSLLCLAIILKYVRSRGRQRGLDVHCQAGGDDSAFVIHGPESTVNSFIDEIKDFMTLYVGAMKEFVVFDLSDYPEGVVPDAAFCKKRIVLSREKGFYHLRGEHSCPLHQSLLPGCDLPSFASQCEAWKELDIGLLNYEKIFPEQFQLFDSLRAAFLVKYPRVKPIRRSSENFWITQYLHYSHGRYFTKQALATINSLEIVRRGPFIALQSFQSKFRHALHNEYVIIRNLHYRGEVVSAVLHPLEEGEVLGNSTFDAVVINPSQESLSKILNIING